MPIEKREDIVFSVTASAVRSNLYKNFYESISTKNKVSFEMIFVGNNPPAEEMPSNFKYIYTKVNPVQCYEIAARNAVGKFLVPVTDDLLLSDEFLDRMYFYLSKLHMDGVLVGNRYQTNGVFYDNVLTLERKYLNSPVIPIVSAFNREVWMKLGGADRRFSYSFFDVDMVLRFYEIGYKPFVIPDNWVNEIIDDTINSSLCKKTYARGRMLTNKFWVKDRIVLKNRLEPVMSFLDKNILIEDQFLNV